MSFPNIVTDRPVGTQMVSTIDDFERETRSWLRQCMIELSGYPDVATISVLGWTNNTRPDLNPNGKYLLGYNEDTQSLEIIGASGSVVNISKAFSLAAHPVGEYYWTSDANFNPNTEWGGTWERIQDGRVLISDNGSHSVGSTGGSETVTLTLSQIPPHQHPHTHKHKHSRGTMNITGTFGTGAETGHFYKNDTSGCFYNSGNTDSKFGDANNGKNDRTSKITLDASRNWSGYTSEDSASASSHAQGGGQAHSNMQPFRTAICWHRTA